MRKRRRIRMITSENARGKWRPVIEKKRIMFNK